MTNGASQHVLHEVEEELFVRDVSNVASYLLFREGGGWEYHLILPGAEAVVLDVLASVSLLDSPSSSLPDGVWELGEIASTRKGQVGQFDAVLSSGRVLALGAITDPEIVPVQTMMRIRDGGMDSCLAASKSSLETSIRLRIPRNRFSANTPWYSRRSRALRRLSFVGSVLSLLLALLYYGRFNGIGGFEDSLDPAVGPSAGASLLIALAFLVSGVLLGVGWAYLRFREPKLWGWSKASMNQSTVFETLEMYGTLAACAWAEVADPSDIQDQLPAVRGAISSIQELRWRGEKARQAGMRPGTGSGLPEESLGRGRSAQIAGAMIQQASRLQELAVAAQSCAESKQEAEALSDVDVQDQRSIDRIEQVEAAVKVLQNAYADVRGLAMRSGGGVELPDPWELPASQGMDSKQEASIRDFEFVPDMTVETLQSMLHEDGTADPRSARLLSAQLEYLDQAMLLAVARLDARQVDEDPFPEADAIDQSLKRVIEDTRIRAQVWQDLRHKDG